MKTINCRGNLMTLESPKIMGILNITPDSFFDGGKYQEKEKIEQRIKEMIAQGVDIIDVGAFSSRPGAAEVTEKEELERLEKALKLIREIDTKICVSVDTFRAYIASYVVKNYEVDIINDIYAGFGSEKMLETIADLHVSYIMMHMQGTPATMQKNPQYQNIVADIIKFFSERINKATYLGINDIIIDPGFGFGKTIAHNYELMNRLEEFQIFDQPLLVGVSRKSMIYKFINIKPENSLPGTIALNTIALLKGASFLRVHDVAEAVQMLKVVEKMKQFEK